VTIVPDASVAVELLLRTPLGEKLGDRLKGATLVAPALSTARCWPRCAS
jgi:hypothetical protein